MFSDSDLKGESDTVQTEEPREESCATDTYCLFSSEEAERLVSEALDTVLDEPEGSSDCSSLCTITRENLG